MSRWKEPLRCILCVRAATLEQSVRGDLILIQLAELRALVEEVGGRVVGECVEIISGSAPLEERKELSHALETLECHNADALVFYDKARMSRSPKDAMLIEQRVTNCGGQILYADDYRRPDMDEGVGQ